VTLRQIWRRLHLWIGLAGGVVFAILGLTGSVLVYQEEILDLLYPNIMHVVPGEVLAPPSQLLATAQQTGGRVAYLRYPEMPDRPVQAALDMPGGQQTVLIDPYAATLIAPLPAQRLFALLLDLHSRMLVKGAAGRQIIGWIGVLLAISAITGIILWWPRPRQWKQALTLKWRGMSWYRRSFDLHKVGGAVIAVPMLLLALSGSAISFREALIPVMSALGGIPQARTAMQPVMLDNAPSVDALAEKALQLMPEARIVFISPPAKPGGATRIRLRQPDEIHQNGRSYVLLDATGTVLDLQRVSELPAANMVFDQLPYPLHTGYLFGAAGRLIVFIAGLLPALLFATGLYLWLRSRPFRRRA
jgi:uncharacterized iron-regulated membrane protein